MNDVPTLTASGEVIYGETPEDGIIAKVYGDPELAQLFAAAPGLLDACKHGEQALRVVLHQTEQANDDNAIVTIPCIDVMHLRNRVMQAHDSLQDAIAEAEKV